MINTKQKAEELAKKYYNLLDSITFEAGDSSGETGISWDEAKECAIIVIDEILENAVNYNAYDGVTDNEMWIDNDYWQKVKIEIEKL